MNKNIKKSLDEKMQVKLPENLEREAIIEQLDSTVQVVTPKKEKRSYAKIIVPIAASLALVVGIAGMFPGVRAKLNNAAEKPDNTTTVQNQVVDFSDYEEIYKKFSKMKRSIYVDDMMTGAVLFGKEEFAVAGDTANGASTVNESAGGIGIDDTADSLRDYGETNNQENGVDEGDIIKTDGKYLYVISRNYVTEKAENSFAVIDCADGKMTKTASLNIKDGVSPSELYICGDYAVVLGMEYNDNYGQGAAESEEIFAVYDCIAMSGDTFVGVYDISDKASPKTVKEFTQQGIYNSSRMIGSKLYCVSTYDVNLYAKDLKDSCIPEVTVNGANKKLPADCISMISETNSPSYAIISALDVTAGAEPQTNAVLGRVNELYVTADNFFLSELSYENSSEITKIYKFGYTDNGVEFEVCGQVPGYLNNQFSLSYDGAYLRVAATRTVVEESQDGDTVSVSMGNTINALYVLDSNLKQVSKVDNLAPGERIKSARFMGNMAYIVTFRQTDPLFAVDLSDPANPKVMGQLKITGFSEYLHPFAENLLIGIGWDGTESGTNGDCKVSLFDVSDSANPTEISKLTVMNGGGYCYSYTANNHKAYVKLSDTDFAVPYNTEKYISSGYYDGHYRNECVYIRYRVENGQLKEIARYYLGENYQCNGGTFVGNTFYAVAVSYNSGFSQVVSFSLDTNEETGRISI
ncbi:MAG: beta-propeller domain-containing protein [Candidatus Fimenecus sp.]